MWLNLLALLMLVIITFFQSLQGLFAALILFVLSVISSAVAFGFYENLYTGLLAKWLPAEGEAVALMAIFLVTLLILRLVTDFGIKGNVPMPPKVDRIGGGLLGFFTAMVMTGMAMTSVQMLPFDRQILGFSRYQTVNGKMMTSGLTLGPDSFATGLARVILDGSLCGKSAEAGTFQENHPDLLAEFDARRSAGPLDKGVMDDSISVERMWWPDRLGDANAPSGTKFLAVRANAAGASAFTPAQIRLVVRRGGVFSSSCRSVPAMRSQRRPKSTP